MRLTILPLLWRVIFCLLLVASATAMTAYLFDVNCPEISPTLWICLFFGAWGSVAYAWLRHRPLPGHWPKPLIATVALIEICVVHSLRDTYFPCPPLPVDVQFAALTNAVANNDLSTVQTILLHDGNVNYRPNTAQTLCSDSSDECLDNFPLHIAVRQGNLAIATALIDHGASILPYRPSDRYDFDPLAIAAARGDIPMVRLLLHHGAPLGTGKDNSAALFAAVNANQIEMVDFLLKLGANPNSRKMESYVTGEYCVLHIALARNNAAMAHRLKQAGATDD